MSHFVDKVSFIYIDGIQRAQLCETLYADGVVWLEIHHGNLSRVLIFAKITHLFEFSKLRFKNTAGFSTPSIAINRHRHTVDQAD
jgi:hypothetical protein